MASIFTKIINREIPAYIIAESSKFIAFLDAFPIKEGHTLIVPKREVDDYFDLTDSEISEMAIFAKQVAKAIEKSFTCKKISVGVFGLEVPHAHMHLIPINSMDDCDFKNPKLKLSPDRMKEIQELIISNVVH
ncbi:MAG TPA: HIT family protein [Salinivirgaceae bacterium]|nr:HIT family protein [Salinivirgaceae bacterium]